MTNRDFIKMQIFKHIAMFDDDALRTFINSVNDGGIIIPGIEDYDQICCNRFCHKWLPECMAESYINGNIDDNSQCEKVWSEFLNATTLSDMAS